MRRRAGEISAETLDERLPVPETGDELQRLAETLNEISVDEGKKIADLNVRGMMKSFEYLDQRQRRFRTELLKPLPQHRPRLFHNSCKHDLSLSID